MTMVSWAFRPTHLRWVQLWAAPLPSSGHRHAVTLSGCQCPHHSSLPEEPSQ